MVERVDASDTCSIGRSIRHLLPKDRKCSFDGIHQYICLRLHCWVLPYLSHGWARIRSWRRVLRLQVLLISSNMISYQHLNIRQVWSLSWNMACLTLPRSMSWSLWYRGFVLILWRSLNRSNLAIHQVIRTFRGECSWA